MIYGMKKAIIFVVFFAFISGLNAEQTPGHTLVSAVSNALEEASSVKEVISVEVTDSMFDKYDRIGNLKRDNNPGGLLYERLDDDGNIIITKEPNTKIVKVVYEAKSNMTNNLTRHAIERVMLDVYEAIYTAGIPVRNARVEAHMILMDAKGNNNLGIIYGTSLSNRDAVDVNWENKHRIDPERLWKTYFKNNAFR